MSFADLAVELKEQIFHEYVQNTDIYEVFRAREVCKTFATMIDDELTSNMPLEKLLYSGFVQYDSDLPGDSRNRHTYPILRKRVTSRAPSARLPDDSTLISSFVHRIADALVSDQPRNANLDNVRAQYFHDIVSILTSPPCFYKCAVILSDRPTYYLDLHRLSRNKRYLESKRLKVGHLVAAAAATENLDVLAKYTEDFFGHLDDDNDDNEIDYLDYSNGYHEWSDQQELLSVDYWYAAAWNGKLKSIQLLLRQLDVALAGEQSSVDKITSSWIYEHLGSSTITAIVSGHSEIAKVLFAYSTRHKDLFSEAHWTRLMYEMIYELFRYGNVEVFDYVITLHPQIKDCRDFDIFRGFDIALNFDIFKAFHEGFISACRVGHTGIIEYVLRSGYRLSFPYEVTWFAIWKWKPWVDVRADEPLTVATGYSRIDIMKILLQYNANISNPNKILEAAVLGLKVSKDFICLSVCPTVSFRKSGSRSETLQFLLDRELPINRSAVHLVNQCAKFIHTDNEGWLSPDVCMAIILLLDVLKSRFGRGDSLRKDVHRGVTRVLGQVIDANLDMPSTRHDFLELATKLYAWLPRLRSPVAKKPKVMEL